MEKLPIPDFRTAGGQSVQGMSTGLLDVIYQSLRRQDWFQDYLRETGSEKPSFVGSFPVGKSVLNGAAERSEGTIGR